MPAAPRRPTRFGLASRICATSGPGASPGRSRPSRLSPRRWRCTSSITPKPWRSPRCAGAWRRSPRGPPSGPASQPDHRSGRAHHLGRHPPHPRQGTRPQGGGGRRGRGGDGGSARRPPHRCAGPSDPAPRLRRRFTALVVGPRRRRGRLQLHVWTPQRATSALERQSSVALARLHAAGGAVRSRTCGRAARRSRRARAAADHVLRRNARPRRAPPGARPPRGRVRGQLGRPARRGAPRR